MFRSSFSSTAQYYQRVREAMKTFKLGSDVVQLAFLVGH